MLLHLFGASTPTGESFTQQLLLTPSTCRLYSYSRSRASFHRADLAEPASFQPYGEPGASSLWISFAPIWLFATFLERLALDHPDRLHGLLGVVACSSSSVITKRYAYNRRDRELVSRLMAAEDQLLATCQHLALPCRILRPTLVYGRVGSYADRNLSFILQLMRHLPFIPVPSHTGVRQPIHASQLAAVALYLVRQFIINPWSLTDPTFIALGGDSELSYTSMLRLLQQALPYNDPARRCYVLPIPNRLFHTVASPLLLYSPKTFEALLRMGVDLSGFTQSHQLLSRQPQPFPVEPFF